MVPRQALAIAQLGLRAAAELAAIVVAGDEERVGDLAAEPAGHVHEADEANHERPGDGHAFAAHRRGAVGLDDLRLVVDHKAKRPPDRTHGQRFERGIEGKTAHDRRLRAQKGRRARPSGTARVC
jgi:hypothetical protein